MIKINPNELKENFFKTIGEQWMLITAGTADKLNTMTASWGGIGYLWNRPVVYIFIRPERYTFDFVNNNSHFSLSFLPEQYRETLYYCGKKSGRDCNKIKETGLTTAFTEQGTPYFTEAELVLDCRKFYSVEIEDGEFVERADVDKWYKNEGVHTMFIAEIESAYYL